MSERLDFYYRNGRPMTLRERIQAARTTAELEDIRLGREHVAAVCGEAVWPDGEGLEFARRKAEIGKAEARG